MLIKLEELFISFLCLILFYLILIIVYNLVFNPIPLYQQYIAIINKEVESLNNIKSTKAVNIFEFGEESYVVTTESKYDFLNEASLMIINKEQNPIVEQFLPWIPHNDRLEVVYKTNIIDFLDSPDYLNLKTSIINSFIIDLDKNGTKEIVTVWKVNSYRKDISGDIIFGLVTYFDFAKNKFNTVEVGAFPKYSNIFVDENAELDNKIIIAKAPVDRSNEDSAEQNFEISSYKFDRGKINLDKLFLTNKKYNFLLMDKEKAIFLLKEEYSLAE